VQAHLIATLLVNQDARKMLIEKSYNLITITIIIIISIILAIASEVFLVIIATFDQEHELEYLLIIIWNIINIIIIITIIRTGSDSSNPSLWEKYLFGMLDNHIE
jgi:lysylphosphatidylglycerol synthetase-like protein (DUF2156 family)